MVLDDFKHPVPFVIQDQSNNIKRASPCCFREGMRRIFSFLIIKSNKNVKGWEYIAPSLKGHDYLHFSQLCPIPAKIIL